MSRLDDSNIRKLMRFNMYIKHRRRWFGIILFLFYYVKALFTRAVRQPCDRLRLETQGIRKRSYGCRTNSQRRTIDRNVARRISTCPFFLRSACEFFRTHVTQVLWVSSDRRNIVRLPCDLWELWWDAAICLRSACDLDRLNSQGKCCRTADVNKALVTEQFRYFISAVV